MDKIEGYLDFTKWADKEYVHVQTNENKVWTIAHNLHKYPSVTLVDDNNKQFIAEVEYIDINTVVITLSKAMSGKAYLN